MPHGILVANTRTRANKVYFPEGETRKEGNSAGQRIKTKERLARLKQMRRNGIKTSATAFFEKHACQCTNFSFARIYIKS